MDEQKRSQSYLMIRKILKNMYAASKDLPVPQGIKLTTDVYRSVHLTLEAKVPTEVFQKYVGELKMIEETNNKQVTPDQETNAIWVHLATNNLSHAEYLCQNGFKIHHGIEQKLTLYKWISSRSDLVTGYSQFYISCGAVVIHDNRILLVQEKNGARKGEYGIPGGRADFGQFLHQCCQRELFEQTGLKAKFKHLLYFRELEKTVFGAMDIYFACLMKLDEESLKELHICERQLSDYKWVPLNEYKQFGAKMSFGTQKEVARYISELAEKGYDFNCENPEQTNKYSYTSPRDKVLRQVVEHCLGKL